MFLDSPTQTLEVSFRVKHSDGFYMVYGSSWQLKCFECGNVGHTVVQTTVVQTVFLIERNKVSRKMEAETMSGSQAADTETHSRSTEEAASTSSGRDYISNDGQSGLNSQA